MKFQLATAVQPESEITASETKGNSEASQTSKVTMPRKEQTPPAPTIIADVERASVSVIPNDESTKVVIKYLDLEDQISTITASKINHQWSLNKVVPGITIEPNSGKVEISYQQHNQKVILLQQKLKVIVMKVEKVKQLCHAKSQHLNRQLLVQMKCKQA